MSFHEVQVDLQGAKIDKSENQFIQRGDFDQVSQSMPLFKKQGIDAIYLMGTLERDNYPFVNNHTSSIQFRKEDASPLAVIDR